VLPTCGARNCNKADPPGIDCRPLREAIIVSTCCTSRTTSALRITDGQHGTIGPRTRAKGQARQPLGSPVRPLRPLPKANGSDMAQRNGVLLDRGSENIDSARSETQRLAFCCRLYQRTAGRSQRDPHTARSDVSIDKDQHGVAWYLISAARSRSPVRA